ncbi:sigma-70 family RNA polymerase sigma factor [Streptomyces sp. L7]
MESITEQETRRLRRARFEGLAQVVTEPLHRYLVRRTAPDMVEDVLSDTMLVVASRRPCTRAQKRVPARSRRGAPLVLRGGAGRCLANARRADGRRLRLVERLTSVQQAPVTVDADHGDLHAALAALGELDREVIRLWAWEELAHGRSRKRPE